MSHSIVVPDELWADFINVLYAADMHVVKTESNEEVMGFIKWVILEAFKEESILVVDGKIIPKKL